MMKLDLKNRIFKIWKYDISHSTLLIRSPKNLEFETNIDLYFSGIKLIKFPNMLKAKEMTPVLIDDDDDIIAECFELNINIEEVYVFRGEKVKYYVVASIITLEENDNDIFDVKF